MELFRWLAIETGERLGYASPSGGDEHVTGWVKRRDAERSTRSS